MVFCASTGSSKELLVLPFSDLNPTRPTTGTQVSSNAFDLGLLGIPLSAQGWRRPRHRHRRRPGDENPRRGHRRNHRWHLPSGESPKAPLTTVLGAGRCLRYHVHLPGLRRGNPHPRRTSRGHRYPSARLLDNPFRGSCNSNTSPSAPTPPGNSRPISSWTAMISRNKPTQCSADIRRRQRCELRASA